MSEATTRALRTLAQNLVLDVGVAVFAVALPLVQAEHINWALLGATVAKTALATAASYIHRKLNELRSTTPGD
ncbi:MAG: hypothetical protein QOF58_8184 [Pseudonocardiales bacterium]|jgi:23S rRNA A1618 N6-methylase RlmF|nr:hypothetical protein [Pseudonocardiales bacterium]